MLWLQAFGQMIQERTWYVTCWALIPMCLPSVYMMLPDTTVRNEISQTFPSVFAYWEKPNTEGGEGPGTRLIIYCTGKFILGSSETESRMERNGTE